MLTVCSSLCVFCTQVADFAWPHKQMPDLEKMVDLCRNLDSWLRADKQNIIVLHCTVRTCLCTGDLTVLRGHGQQKIAKFYACPKRMHWRLGFVATFAEKTEKICTFIEFTPSRTKWYIAGK